MGNEQILSGITKRFLEKIDLINESLKKKIPIILDEGSLKKSDSEWIHVILLGYERNLRQNLHNKIQLKETSKEGETIEYHTDPPTLMDIKFALMPKAESRLRELEISELLLKFFKDNNSIEVGEFDWHENKGNPIHIFEMTEYKLDKQVQVLNALGVPYKPSLFYQFTIGINSDRKDVFRRVQERKIETIKKKD